MMVLKKTYETKELALTACKEHLHLETADWKMARKWFYSSPDNSYKDPQYQVDVFVLEGSPPRGILLCDEYHKTIYLINRDKIKRIRYGQYQC